MTGPTDSGRWLRHAAAVTAGVLLLGAWSATTATPAAAAEAVTVAIAAPPDPIAPGQTVKTPVAVANTGDVASVPSTVVVKYPKSVSGGPTISFSIATGITCSVVSPRYGSRTATCTVPALDPGASATVGTLKVVAPSTVPYAGYTLSATATGPTNSASATYRIRGSGPADLVPSVYLNPSTVMTGRTVVANVSIVDAGYTSAPAFNTHITLPPGAVVVLALPTPGTTCALAGDGLDCSSPGLANGASLAIPVAFDAPQAAGIASVVVSTDVSDVVAEGNESNNTASANLDTRDAAAALQVAVTNPAVVYQGTLFTRSITVTNIGGATATTATLADRFTQFGFVSAVTPPGTSCTKATSWSGRPAKLHAIGANCSLGDLAPGASVTVQLTLSVAGTLAAGSYTDTATAATSSYADPNVTPSTTGTTVVTAPPSPLPPANTALPVITGDVNTGSTVSLSNGSWVGKGTITYSYQWLRCDSTGGSCTNIVGATAATYVVQPDDVGGTLRGTVTATSSGGPTTAVSNPTAIVVGAVSPVSTVAPTLVPGLEEQPTFAWSVTTGTWSGTPTMTFTYQWQRCNVDGTGCVDIVGATSSVYVLQEADVFSAVRVRVTATNTAGSGVAYSNLSGEIDPYG